MNAMLMELFGSHFGAPLLLVMKGTTVLFCAAVVAVLLRRAAPAARHLVWALAVVTLLVLPLASEIVPTWRIPVILELATSTPEAATSAAPASSMMPTSQTAVSNVAAAPAAARMSTTGKLLLAWLVGAAAVLAWLLLGRVMLHAVLRRALPVTDASWNESLADAGWLLELDRPVGLFRSSTARTPVTWGVLRPVIVLPEEATTWDEERRRAVLLHELSHVVRQDCLTQLVAGVACALWWFHPGAWYAAHRMRVERERACDQRVLACGTPAPEYAAHLLELARRFSGSFPAPLGLHMARPGQLEGRLLAVLAGVSPRRAPGRTAVVVAAIVSLLVTLPLSAVQPSLSWQIESTYAGNAAPEVQQTVAPDVATESEAPAPEPRAPTPREVSAPLAVDTPPNVVRQVNVSTDGDSVARLVPRIRIRDASFAITTRDGHKMLLLRDTSMVLQLTDRGLAELGKQETPTEEEDGFLSALVGTMLRSGLRMLLDRGIEYSLYDLQEARVEDGRLVFESRSGEEVFDGVEINGSEVMEQFSEPDARAFAQRVNRARERLQR